MLKVLILATVFLMQLQLVFAQVHQGGEVVGETAPLTWEQFTSDAPPFPFEAKLNACIENDRRNRGFGAPCQNIPYQYCPDGPEDATIRVLEKDVIAQCGSYVRRFWQKRLDQAHSDLIEIYTDVDVEDLYPRERRPQFEAVHTLWTEWRDAKCSFISDGEPHYPWIQIAVMQCRTDMTSLRALELEQLRSLWFD